MKKLNMTSILPVFLITIAVSFVGYTAEVSASAKPDNFKMSIEQSEDDPVSYETYYDISLMVARSVFHTLEAAEALDLGMEKEANQSVKQARTLIEVAGKMLPNPSVKATIHDAKGNVVYADERQVHEREIPIFSGMTTLEVVQPIIKYKKSRAVLKGYKPDGEMTLFTLILVDIDYFDHRLEQCQSLLSSGKADVAYKKLEDAISFGVRIEEIEQDQDLVRTVEYTVRAYRQTENKNYTAARKSLKKARKSLEVYAETVDMKENPWIQELMKEIETLDSALEDSASKIQKVWYRLVQRLRGKS